jgi:hypothetical protein
VTDREPRASIFTRRKMRLRVKAAKRLRRILGVILPKGMSVHRLRWAVTLRASRTEQHRTSSSHFFFSHPPRPPESCPCSSAHGRGWEEFSPAGSRAGPRAGLGLPKLGLSGQDGCFSMVSFDGFACAMVSFCDFPFLRFSSVSYGFIMYGLSFCLFWT